MNILIVSTNRCSNPVFVLPYGACLVAGACERAGHRVRVLDLMFERDPSGAVQGVLRGFPADLIGISIRNIDNNDMRNPVLFFREIVPLVAEVRRASRAPVVLGGAAVGIMPEASLRRTGADFAVPVDGETVFPELAGALQKGEDGRSVAGVTWLENGVFRALPRPRPSLPLTCRVPEFSRWVSLRTYLRHLACVPVQTKQGCPFECVYCTYSISEGNAYRLCRPADVAARLLALRAQGIRDVEFVDNVFNEPCEHARNICSEIIAAGSPVRLHTVELNPRSIDEALIVSMEKAGFSGAGITLESAADPVLAGLRKNFRSADVRRAAEVIGRSSLSALWMFMLGGPGETRETVEETLSFAGRFIRPHDVAFFNIGLRVYPGTELERIARREGVLNIPADKMLEPVSYIAPGLDKDWLVRRMDEAVKEHYNFIHSSTLSLPFLPFLYRFGYRMGFRPPVWKHTRSLRASFRFLGVPV